MIYYSSLHHYFNDQGMKREVNWKYLFNACFHGYLNLARLGKWHCLYSKWHLRYWFAVLFNIYSYALAFSGEARVYPIDLPLLCLVSYTVAMKHKNVLCIKSCTFFISRWLCCKYVTCFKCGKLPRSTYVQFIVPWKAGSSQLASPALYCTVNSWNLKWH